MGSHGCKPSVQQVGLAGAGEPPRAFLAEMEEVAQEPIWPHSGPDTQADVSSSASRTDGSMAPGRMPYNFF